jgi:RimJ/RimL family protein N-acetyltransferase
MLLPDLTLTLGGGYLRTLGPDDVTGAYVDGLNDPEVHRYLVAPRQSRQSLETVKAYVLSNQADPRAALFGVFVDDVLRGSVRLHDIDGQAGTAYVGIALFDKTVWGQGWGRRAIVAVQEYVQALGVNTLFAGIESGNSASRACFTAAGFRCTSTSPGAGMKGLGETWEWTRGELHG